jgi:hypothetical protein
LSEIRADTISAANGTGPVTLTGQSAAKAWVNFTGISTTALRDSLNVSSLTDIGVGRTGINFSSAMANDTYTGSYYTNASSTSTDGGFSNHFVGGFAVRTTSSYRLWAYNASASVDSYWNDSIIQGDLA